MSKSETQGDVWLEAVHDGELARLPAREGGGSLSSECSGRSVTPLQPDGGNELSIQLKDDPQ